jgi:hypothetical protein
MTTLPTVVIRDIYANLPAAGIPGRMFYASDTGAGYRDNGTTWDQVTNIGGSGSVTSIAVAAPAEFTVSGSPVTTSGTITIGKATETANTVWAGPTTGAAAAPTFRALVANDLPGGVGTVSSVALTMPGEFSVSGSPITSSGTLAVTKAGQNPNLFYAGPSGGGAAVPTFRAIATVDLPSNTVIGAIGIVIDGGGSSPTTGSKGFIQIPYSGTITSWTMLGDISGSAQVTVKKSTYSGFPTTSSIVASAPPNLSSAQKNTNSTLTGWTTTFTAGDIMEFNLDSVTTITRITLELAVSRS